jgi:molybdopterin-binding protein
MDCGYKFKKSSPTTPQVRAGNGRGRWIGAMVLVLIVGSLLGYFSGYFLIPPTTQTVTVTQPTTRSIEKMLTMTIEKTLVTTEMRTSTVMSVMGGTVERTVTMEVVREETVTITTTRNMTEEHITMRVGEEVNIDGYEFSAISVESPGYIKLGENITCLTKA